MKKKLITMSVAIAIVFALSLTVIGTVAWLVDTTDSVVNTFTVGDINIDLDESDDLDLKMMPGKEITKDPVITVEAGSEACWLFVKIDESTDFDDYMTYSVASGWTALSGVDGVYYREVAAVTADTEFTVIADNKVTVKDTVTKAQLNAIKDGTVDAPTLTFTAYAVQKENISSASAAWAVL